MSYQMNGVYQIYYIGLFEAHETMKTLILVRFLTCGKYY